MIQVIVDHQAAQALHVDLEALPDWQRRQLMDRLTQLYDAAEARHDPRHLISAWRDDYNHHRPHTSLDGLTPWEYHQLSKEDQNRNRASL